ncbi:MAG: MBL fold metallo-hydrolase [bacterium]
MKLLFGGVRGSNSRSGAAYSRFGGDTTSFALIGAAGEPVVFDLGSGVQAVNHWLPSGTTQRSLLVLFTHYHLDHVMGIGGFAPLYDPAWQIEFAAPLHGKLGVEQVVTRLLAFPFWPLAVESLGADSNFRNLPTEPVADGDFASHAFGGLLIRHCPVHHPDGCSAYRVDEPATGGSVIIATDMEWRRSHRDEQASFLALCRAGSPVQTLVMDGQFAASEYEAHTGWGHSSLDDAAAIAREVGAARLLITHHSPENDDDRLTELEAELQAAFPNAALIRQGMELTIGA